MKKIILAILLMGPMLSGYSQSDDENSVSDKFFLGIATSYYLDLVTTPVTFTYEATGNTVPIEDPDNPGQYIYVDEYADIPYQSSYLSYFSFGMEPRFNLHEINNNMAIGVSAPFTIGLGQAGASNSDVRGTSGMGSLQLPILLKFFMGSGSTYEATDDFGLSVGGGLEVNKIAIFSSFGQDVTNNPKAWVMPTVCGGIHFWRGGTPMEVNVKYGFGKLQSYTHNQYGQRINSGSRTTRAKSIKLTFIYLVNY